MDCSSSAAVFLVVVRPHLRIVAHYGQGLHLESRGINKDPTCFGNCSPVNPRHILSSFVEGRLATKASKSEIGGAYTEKMAHNLCGTSSTRPELRYADDERGRLLTESTHHTGKKTEAS